MCWVSPYLPGWHSEENLRALYSRSRDKHWARVWAGLNWDLRDLPSWKLIPAKSPDCQIGKGMRGLDKEFRRQIQPKVQPHKTSITPVNLEAIITCLWIMAFKFFRYWLLFPGEKYNSLSLCWAPIADLGAKFSFILFSLFLWSLLSPYLQNNLNLLELYHLLQKETPPFSHWICKLSSSELQTARPSWIHLRLI